MSDSNASSSGISGIGLLLVIFICAKVFEIGPIAHWGWFWVFSPMWMPLVVLAGGALLAFTVLMAAAWFSEEKQ